MPKTKEGGWMLDDSSLNPYQVPENEKKERSIVSEPPVSDGSVINKARTICNPDFIEERTESEKNM